MRLLITGGAGCLGSELANHFASRGHEVLVFDNFSTGDPSWLESSGRIEVREGSVSNKQEIEAAFTQFGPSHVIHAAASYANPDDWLGDLATNTTGTLNVVKACESSKVGTLVYLQTALGYGKPTASPISVEHSLNPISSYGISKVAGELYVLAASIPSSISLRLANVCAPRLAIGPLPTFFKKISAGEVCTVTEAERDFLSIEDFLSLTEKVLHFEQRISGAFNVSSGRGKTIRQVFEAVAEAIGAEDPKLTSVPIGADDIQSVVLDPELTQQTFGWAAQKDFREIVQQQVRWFELYGVGQIRSHLKNTELDDRNNND